MTDIQNRFDLQDRIEALRRSGLLDRPQAEEFGTLTEHVRDVLEVPVAIVTLVDEHRQVFAGHSGMPSPWAERGETPMTHSFCQHVVERFAPLSIPDARLDPLVKDNHAIWDIGVVAYLGVPLTLPDGEVVGALAAIDDKAREWTPADLRRLGSIARTVEKELRIRISESRWRSLFEGLKEGFLLGRVIRDEEGRIIDWLYEEVNAAWYDLIGLPHGTVVGRTVRDIFSNIEDEWIDQFAQVVTTGQPGRFTRRVGSLGRWYEGLAQAIGRDRFTVIFMDVTDRLMQQRRQSALLQFGDALRDLSGLEAIVQAATRCVETGLEADRFGFGFVDEEREIVEIPSDTCAPGVRSIAGRHAFRAFGSFIEDLKRGATVAIPDVTLDPRTSASAETFAQIQIRALMNLPIREGGRLVLVVFAHGVDARAWTEAELNFVQQVGDRMQAAIGRLRAEDGQRMLNQELAHRMKNSLALVMSIATQTMRQATSIEDAREGLLNRLSALSRAQDTLIRPDFDGTSVRDVVNNAIAAHNIGQISVSEDGERTILGAPQALALSLAIHELATNAAKYGALSTETGSVAIGWRSNDGEFEFAWVESGGPLVAAPERRGFGSRLIERFVASSFDGEGHLAFEPAGVRFTLKGRWESE